jgi:hypothetical protein
MTVLEWTLIALFAAVSVVSTAVIARGMRERRRLVDKAAELARRADAEDRRIRALTAELDARARATAVPTTALPAVRPAYSRTNSLTGAPIRKRPHGSIRRNSSGSGGMDSPYFGGAFGSDSGGSSSGGCDSGSSDGSSSGGCD